MDDRCPVCLRINCDGGSTDSCWPADEALYAAAVIAGLVPETNAPGGTIPRTEKTLVRWTAADADDVAGRVLTEDELALLEYAVDNSTMGEAFGDVVAAVTS